MSGGKFECGVVGAKGGVVWCEIWRKYLDLGFGFWRMVALCVLCQGCAGVKGHGKGAFVLGVAFGWGM